MTGRQLRDVTGLADRIRRSAEHSPESTHPSRGPLISVATVLTLLDGCPGVGEADDGPDLTIGQGLRLEDVREWTVRELGIGGGVDDELAMLLDQADRWFGGIVHTAHVREVLDRRGAGA